VIARLVDEAARDAEVEELAQVVDPVTPANLEFGLLEGRRAFVLSPNSFTMVAMRHRRVIGYARVSSEEQARGSSLQDQQDAIGAYAKGHGLKVARFYVEAESAVHEKIEHRDQIRALMADVRRGDLVVCAKLDRWSRDPEFTYGSVRKILEAGASFFSVDERCDPNTPEGDTALGFRILFAREEHKRIRERMVGTRKLLRDRGYYVEGLPPFGYRRALPKGHKGEAKNVLVVHDDEAKVVRRAFALSASGHSLSKIAAAVGLTRDRVRSVLGSRVFLGEVQNTAGEWIRAKHAPIVDAETFARAQVGIESRRLGGERRRAGPSATSTWILRDVATCAKCGARMSAVYGGGNGDGTYERHYYRCAHKCQPGGLVPVADVEAEAEPFIVARLEQLREELGREPKRTAKAPPSDVGQLRAKLARRRERYLEAFADDFMTKEELRERLGKLDAESLRLDAREQAARRPSPLADPKTRRSALREVETIRRAWARAAPEARREIVQHLVTAARMVKGARLRVEWRSAEDLVSSPL
jgi:DNA invertase Pin-like site-specific DNA recombinase